MYHFIFSETRQALWREVAGFPRSQIQAKLAFRAALAALVAVLLAMWLQTDHYYWAGITAIVVTRPNIGETLLKGCNRLLGTIAGGILAVAVMSLCCSSRVAMMLVIFILSACTIWVAAHRGQDNYGYVMTGFTAVVTVLGFLTQPEALYAGAVYRVLEIGLGVVVAFCINGLLFPISSAPSLRAGQERALALVRQLMGVAVSGYLGNRSALPRLEAGVKELGKVLAASGNAFSNTRLEQSLTPAQRHYNANLLSFMGSCREALAELACLADMAAETSYPRRYRGEIALLVRAFGDMLRAFAVRVRIAEATETEQASVEAFRRAVAALLERYEQLRGTPQHLEHSIVAILAFNQFMGIFTRLAESLDEAVTLQATGGREQLVDKTILRQAVAGGIAMVLVPLLWMWYDLPSITEIAVSALIVLQLDDLETFRKGVLRVTGCILGGTIGLLLLGAPGMGSLPVWMLCLFGFSFFFCYINFGDARCSYIGLQGTIALIMSLVQGNGPGESLEPPVVRLAAIIVAIVVMNVVISLLGVAHPRQRLENLFKRLRARTKDVLEALASQAEGGGAGCPELLARFQELGRSADKTIALLDRMAETPRAQLETLKRGNRCFMMLFRHLRAMSRALGGLGDVGPGVPALLHRMAAAMADPETCAGKLEACRQTLLDAMQRDRNLAAGQTDLPCTEKMHLAAVYLGLYALVGEIARLDPVSELVIGPGHVCFESGASPTTQQPSPNLS